MVENPVVSVNIHGGIIPGIIDSKVAEYLSEPNIITNRISGIHEDLDKIAETIVKALEKTKENDLPELTQDHYVEELRHGAKEYDWLFSSLPGQPNLAVHVSLDRRFVSIKAASDNKERASKFVEYLTPLIPLREPSEDNHVVPFRFWYRNSRGVLDYRDRDITCPFMEDLEGNYTPNIYANLKKLSELKEPYKKGKIILWHGPPGTGKTYSIRALARDWAYKYNASVEFILDPVSLLGDAGLMSDLFLAASDIHLPSGQRELDEDDEDEVLEGIDRLRLIIVEDKADMFSLNCRNNPAFSTLLNLSDGLIGQGLPIVFLFTANEKLESIDPAVRRPGRCLSSSYFGALSPEQANQWLAAHGSEETVSHETILADLYAKTLEDDTDIELDFTNETIKGFGELG